MLKATGEIVESGEMLSDQMGGREAIIQGIRNAFQGVLAVATEFSNVWGKGFWGKDTEKRLQYLIQGFVKAFFYLIQAKISA